MEILLGAARSPVTVIGFVSDVSYSGQGTLWAAPGTWRDVVKANRPDVQLPDDAFQALVVQADDDVAHLQAGAIRRQPRLHRRDHCALYAGQLVNLRIGRPHVADAERQEEGGERGGVSSHRLGLIACLRGARDVRARSRRAGLPGATIGNDLHGCSRRARLVRPASHEDVTASSPTRGC